MRNTYGGTCYRCNKFVNPGDGHFELIPWKKREQGVYRVQKIRWRLQHANCAIVYRGTSVGNNNLVKEEI